MNSGDAQHQVWLRLQRYIPVLLVMDVASVSSIAKGQAAMWKCNNLRIWSRFASCPDWCPRIPRLGDLLVAKAQPAGVDSSSRSHVFVPGVFFRELPMTIALEFLPIKHYWEVPVKTATVLSLSTSPKIILGHLAVRVGSVGRPRLGVCIFSTSVVCIVCWSNLTIS
jgi:hypothetical protein